jgi:hypothetical protein
LIALGGDVREMPEFAEMATEYGLTYGKPDRGRRRRDPLRLTSSTHR